MKRVSLILVASVLLFTFSCKNTGKKDTENMKEDVEDALSTTDSEGEDEDSITISKVDSYQNYDDVTLEMTEPAEAELESGNITFTFDVQNIDIGEVTQDADDQDLANSDEGQHIHFIVDNEPYEAEYEESFEHELDDGVHTIVAFPARSYHMSVKNENAFIAQKVKVGNAEDDQFEDLDLANDPTLVYSRPKGEYKGEEETEKVLLDFYLLNTDLASDGYKVKATINGEEFTIDEWAPYAIEGLPMGENTVKLELVDSDGELVEGPFNDVERTFTLEK